MDDSRDTRQLYAAYLRHRRFTTATALDGDVAIERALQLRPDVIVMDLAMPRVDGINATLASSRTRGPVKSPSSF